MVVLGRLRPTRQHTRTTNTDVSWFGPAKCWVANGLSESRASNLLWTDNRERVSRSGGPFACPDEFRVAFGWRFHRPWFAGGRSG